MPNEQQNRLKDLVLELVGADMVKTMLVQAVENLTDEQRKMLASAACERARQELSTQGSYSATSNAIDREIMAAVNRAFHERQDEFEEMIRERVAREVPTYIERCVSNVVTRLQKPICETLVEKIRTALAR